MTDNALALKRTLPVRALLMFLMCLAFQFAAWVLIVIALLQLGFAAFNDAPNPRLQSLGRGIGRYLGQIAAFVSFASEAAPFPFSDWPSTEA